MLATSLRRLNLRPAALGIRHKLLLALALVVLVCWFNLGSLRSSSKLTSSSSSVEETIERFKQEKLDRAKSGLDQDPTIPKALKAKEYPDFDYRSKLP